MSNFKPGEFRITDDAMEIWKLPKGATILDIGCGQGDTVEYLEKAYEFKASGIDISKDMISDGLAKNPNLDIKHGDGEFLDGYSSYSFDGVMMECVLSLVNMPDEVLHEAYCVLKKGGKLLISDLYIKNPDQELLKSVQNETDRQRAIPFREKECGSHSEEEGSDCSEGGCDDFTDYVSENSSRAVNFRYCGRFLITPLANQLKEIGYINISWKDYSIELDNFMAEKILRDGNLEGCFCPEALNQDDKCKTGYFMLTAEKPLH